MAVVHIHNSILDCPDCDSHSGGMHHKCIASTTGHRSTGCDAADPHQQSKLPALACMLGKPCPLQPQQPFADKIRQHSSAVGSQSQGVIARWAGRQKDWLFTTSSFAATEGGVKIHIAMPALFSTRTTESPGCLNLKISVPTIPCQN